MFVWVTGAKGLLGGALAEREGVIGTGREEVDLTKGEEIDAFLGRHPQITHIVNAAAFSEVERAEKEPELAFAANALAPELLAKGAAKRGIKLLHISTDYIFGGEGRVPIPEEAPAHPCNTYGKSKLEGEKRVLAADPTAQILRVSWLFGGRRGKGKNFVAKLLALFEREETVRLTNDQWGRPTYVGDLAPFIFSLLEGEGGVYHFANAGVTTKYEFGLAMYEEAKRVGLPLKTEEILSVPGSTFPSLCPRPVYSAFDTSKIEREFQRVPRPWREALREEMEEYAKSASETPL